ncbi:type 1 pili tip component [Marinimicrobium sp. C2-29]|uniref:type 1 pili tip component n=1 Tax=Marinimicrobium sp. C2-29 TaxID=3139825 RepID=UPI00313900B0
MKVSELMSQWEKGARGQLTKHSYEVRLPLEDAAKLEALCELYPKKSADAFITDLLSAALNEIETGIPYEQGSKVVTRDEMGDPIYEDVGLTPRFLSLSQKHLQRLKDEQDETGK